MAAHEVVPGCSVVGAPQVLGWGYPPDEAGDVTTTFSDIIIPSISFKYSIILMSTNKEK